MQNPFKITAVLLLCAFLAPACATRSHVADEYGDFVKDQNIKTSKQTTILFLVDGLPLQTFSEEINSGKLGNIRSFFLGQKKEFYKARTSFPSLTFPAISSLLTESPVESHGVYGNVIYTQGKKISFEDPKNYPVLNQMISGKNIFSRLKAKGLKTVSIDYAFSSDSNAHTSINDLEAANAYLNKDYYYIDSKLIDSLNNLLTQTSVDAWPDFIFVHIIGVDLTSHDHGPKSAAAKEYLEKIDEKLKEVFNTLTKIESSHERKIISLMTSDHGFDDEVSKLAKIEDFFTSQYPSIKFLDEGRFGSFYLPQEWNPSQRQGLAQSLLQKEFIDVVAYRTGDTVSVQSHELQTTFSLYSGYVSSSLYYPYFISNLAHYFRTEGHPDFVVIPKPGVAFNGLYKGQHGGPTPQETIVPLLIHNGKLSSTEMIPALWELLGFL